MLGIDGWLIIKSGNGKLAVLRIFSESLRRYCCIAVTIFVHNRYFNREQNFNSGTKLMYNLDFKVTTKDFKNRFITKLNIKNKTKPQKT